MRIQSLTKKRIISIRNVSQQHKIIIIKDYNGLLGFDKQDKEKNQTFMVQSHCFVGMEAITKTFVFGRAAI